MASVIDIIKQDHRTLEGLFEKARHEVSTRATTVQEIEARLRAHSIAEEEKVYPAVMDSQSDADKVHHGVEEHREAEEKLEALKHTNTESEEFITALDAFVSAVKHHVDEEENDILPALKDAVDEDQLEEMAEDFKTRRDDVLSSYHL